MAKPMTEAGERAILATLAKVAGLVNDGLAPDEAIAKAAAADGMPPGYVPLLVNAYNIGRTTRAREDGRDAREKAADFPVASVAGVLDRAFPAAVKTAAAAERDAGVAAEYRLGPIWYRDPAAAAERDALDGALEATIKAAAAPAPVAPAQAAHDRDRAVAAALAGVEKRARAAAESRLTVIAARDALVAKIAALEGALAAPGGLGLADVRPSVEALHGRPGAALLDYMAATRPLLAKAAARRPFHPVDRGAAPYAQVDAALGAARGLAAAEAASAKLAAAHAALDREALAPLRPAGPHAPSCSVLDGGPEKSADVRGGIGYALGTSAIEAVSGGLKPPEREWAVRKALSRIATPDHEQQLAEIEARAHLAEMFNRDEVLSGYHPAEVADHFNRFSQFAPAASRRPLLAVPLVRKSLQQGHLDQFDAGEVASTEQKLRPQPAAPAPQPKKKEAAHASASVLA